MIKLSKDLPSTPFSEYSKLHDLKPEKLEKFKMETNCEKAFSSYQEAISEFERDLQRHSETSPEQTLQLLKGIRVIREKRSQLNLISYLIPHHLKQMLQEQENALQDIEAALLCDSLKEKQGISKEETSSGLCQKARELEKEIDLSLLYREEEYPKEWLETFSSKIERAHQLYQQTASQGDTSASADSQRTAIILHLFKDFEKTLMKLGHRYVLSPLFNKTIKYPLEYLDPRLQPILRFYNQISTCERKEVEEKAEEFISEFMNLPPSDLSLLILQMANDNVHSELFTKEPDEDELDLREIKLELLIKIVKASKDSYIPECKDLPTKTVSNKNIGRHPRIKFMHYAFSRDVHFQGRLEWHVDMILAKFRENCLQKFVYTEKNLNENEKSDHFGYILRHRARKLGLFLQPQAEIGYDFERIKKSYLNNMPTEALKSKLYSSNGAFTDNAGEKNSVSHLLNSLDILLISSLFKNRLTQQGLEDVASWNSYFENDGRLSYEGARALLFGLGYLKEKK